MEIPELLTADLEKFVDCEVGDDLLEFLSIQELEAMFSRAKVLLKSGHFPEDPTGTRFPWPVI